MSRLRRRPTRAWAGRCAAPGEPPASPPILTPTGCPLERSWQSPLDPARRYGVRGELFYKIALAGRPEGAPARRHDLLGEARMLRRCQGIPGDPRGPRLERRRRQPRPGAAPPRRAAAEPARGRLGAAGPAPAAARGARRPPRLARGQP